MTDENSSNYYSPVDINRMIDGLSNAEFLILERASVKYSKKYGLDSRDLLHEAFVRALDGRRKCPLDVKITAFLVMSMKSVAWDLYQKDLPERSAQGLIRDYKDDKTFELMRDERTPESAIISKDILEKLIKSCEKNENAYLVIQARQEVKSKEYILSLLGNDIKKYSSALRYIRRCYNSLIKERE